MAADTLGYPDPGPLPRRWVGWSVERADGSSSFGTFADRVTADEWCALLSGPGRDLVVRQATQPDLWAGVTRLRARLLVLEQQPQWSRMHGGALFPRQISVAEVRALLGDLPDTPETKA